MVWHIVRQAQRSILEAWICRLKCGTLYQVVMFLLGVMGLSSRVGHIVFSSNWYRNLGDYHICCHKLVYLLHAGISGCDHIKFCSSNNEPKAWFLFIHCTRQYWNSSLMHAQAKSVWIASHLDCLTFETFAHQAISRHIYSS
jgi:hypothetical protein